MCYTTVRGVHVSIETSPLNAGAAYGTDGYRADCRNYPFNQACSNLLHGAVLSRSAHDTLPSGVIFIFLTVVLTRTQRAIHVHRNASRYPRPRVRFRSAAESEAGGLSSYARRGSRHVIRKRWPTP